MKNSIFELGLFLNLHWNGTLFRFCFRPHLFPSPVYEGLAKCGIKVGCLCFRYQINARTELSIRYNDISPLENHHAAVAFDIISQVWELYIYRHVQLLGY